MLICDHLENLESLNWPTLQHFRDIRFTKSVLKHYQTMKIEEILDFFKLPVLMLEEAPLAIRTIQLLVEGGARLRLVLIVVHRGCLPH